MQKLLFSVALIAWPACLSAGAVEKTLAGPVTYEVRSWGRILLHWQINPDGSGEIWRSGQEKEAALRKFRLQLEGTALQTFITNVEDAREATRGGIPCKKEIFDLPYGSVTWDYPDAKQIYSFDAGCRSKEGDDAQDILTAATSNVETLAKIETKPYIIEPVPQR